ncbi:phage holin family protein [Bacillus sp. JJ1566]|uniref:phage holin family protein n=1 Tax=Bacillus sp. JJ1566 TaxID=3122961 RepID=UPI002FFFC974
MNLLKTVLGNNTLFSERFREGLFTLGPIATGLNILFGISNLIWVLILAFTIVIDWISGTRAAKVDGSYSSEYGKAGISRTVVMLLLSAFGNLIDIALASTLKVNGFEFGIFFFLITGGLIYHTLMSAAANFERAGWGRWVPVKVIESVASEIQAKTQRSNERKDSINSK